MDNAPWYLQPPEDVVAELHNKADDYYNACSVSGLTRMWRVAWAQYFGADPDQPGQMVRQQLQRVGSEREYTKININHVRSFIKQSVQTAIGTRPAFKATTENSDFTTLAGIDTADRGITSVMKSAFPNAKRRRFIEAASVLGAAFAHVRWDTEGGDDTEDMVPVTDPATGQPAIDPRTGQPATETVQVKSGAPVVQVGYPWQCYYDTEEEDALSWVVVKERRSKWELAAVLPEHADELQSMGGEDKWSRDNVFAGNTFVPAAGNSSSDVDMVTVHHFYLACCASAPQGRYIAFVDDLVLYDRALPVQSKNTLPVVVLMPSAYIGAFLGYADSWDTIAIQQLLDNVVSDWATNIRAFGRMNLIAPKGTGLNYEAMAKGVRALEYPQGQDKPEYLVPPRLDNAETILRYLHAQMQDVTQQNAVRRGDPQANIKSGTMAALFKAQAIEYEGDKQEAFDGAETAIANIVFEMLRTKTRGSFMIQIAGESSRPYWEAFSKAALKGVKSVHVESVSPMMRSLEGRFEAYQAISQVPPEDRGKILRGLDTGDWSGYAEVDKSADLRVIRENELLMQGKHVKVGAGDAHDKHVPSHWALFERLESCDPTLTEPDGSPLLGDDGAPMQSPYFLQKQAVLSHILEHTQQWYGVDPGLAMLLKIPAPPPIPGTPTGTLMQMTGSAMAGPPPGAQAQQDPNAPPPQDGSAPPPEPPQPKEAVPPPDPNLGAS